MQTRGNLTLKLSSSNKELGRGKHGWQHQHTYTKLAWLRYPCKKSEVGFSLLVCLHRNYFMPNIMKKNITVFQRTSSVQLVRISVCLSIQDKYRAALL